MPMDHGIVCRPEMPCKAHAPDSGSRPSAVAVGAATPVRRGCGSSRCPSARALSAHRTTALRARASGRWRTSRGPGPGHPPPTHNLWGPRDPTPEERRGAGTHAVPSFGPQPPRPSDGRGPRPSGARRCPWQGALRGPGSPRPIPLAALPPGPHSPGILSERGDLHMARRAWSCGAYRSRRRRAAGKRLGDAQSLEGKRSRWSAESYSPAARSALPPTSRSRPSAAPCKATESAPQASGCGGGASEAW